MSGGSSPDAGTLAEFERLMTLAHVNRRRGDYRQASEQASQAIRICPDNLDAQEFVADLLYAQGKWEEALAAYSRIRERDPGRASTEEKFAKVTLQIAEGKRQKELLRYMIENPGAYRPAKRNPAIAALLSGIAGLGHVYCGQVAKGAIIFALTILSWLIFFSLTPPVAAYPSAADRIVRFTQDLSVIAWIFMLIALALQMYAIVNAAVVAEKMNSSQDGTL